MKKPRGKHTTRRKLSESPAILAAGKGRRSRDTLLVTGVVLGTEVTILKPSELKRLNIDEGYQRLRITSEVNDLIHVIRDGGQIPAPVQVVERPDGTWWIVDGQQRFWAHFDCDAPLRVLIHKVKDRISEQRLFRALNTQIRINSDTTIKGWDGISGKLLHSIAEDDWSPFKGLVAFTSNRSLPLSATLLAKGVYSVATGGIPLGAMEKRILPRLDTELRKPGTEVWVREWVRLSAAVFEPKRGTRVPPLPFTALGRVAHRRYGLAGRPIFPESCYALKRANLVGITPTQSQRYIAVVEQAIEQRWKNS